MESAFDVWLCSSETVHLFVLLSSILRAVQSQYPPPRVSVGSVSQYA